MKSRVFLSLTTFGLMAAVQAAPTYLALGDSLAYGLTPDPNGSFGYNAPSDGNRYYVASIATATGATQVVNLSIPGETSTSFGDLTNLFRGANTQYGPNVFSPRPISQLDFAQEKIASLGAEIQTVSFAIGANDFLALSGELRSDPAVVQAAFVNIANRYTSFLTSVRGQLPTARLILPGYYNPYLPEDSRHDQADPVIRQLNATIQGFATTFNGRYVDFYTPIEGNQASLLATGDIHPNAAGYAVLGSAAAQAVPEPATLVALALGATGLLRRRRAARKTV